MAVRGRKKSTGKKLLPKRKGKGGRKQKPSTVPGRSGNRNQQKQIEQLRKEGLI